MFKRNENMKLAPEQINEIAQYLDAGEVVYINRNTLEFKDLPDWDLIMNEEIWQKEFEKIEKEWSDYVIIKKMSPRQAYKIMEDFTEEIDDYQLKNEVLLTLNYKKPFANFKALVESSNYRQKWFDFKQKRYEDYVRKQLDLEDIEYE